MTLGELADGLIALRGTSVEEPRERRRLASALVRVAYEAEQAKAEPRLHLRRSKSGLLLAASTGLADYAEALGAEADKLAAEVPLPPTVRVFQRLYEVPQPEFPPDCPPPGNERLLRLAAASSEHAAVSTRQEVYPRGLEAARALQLGLGALSGLEEGFDPKTIRERIAARYPEAATAARPARTGPSARRGRAGRCLG